MATVLPVELLDHIAQYASTDTQVRLAVVSRAAYNASVRALYTSIAHMSISRTTRCLLTLSANLKVACLVRSFSLNIHSCQILQAFRALLARALGNMTGLHVLSLQFERFAISSVLSWVSCRLAKFVCAAEASGDAYLISDFLSTQPAIEELSIYCSQDSMATLDPGTLPVLRSLSAPLHLLPKLLPSRLPRISRLSIIGGIADVQGFVLLGAVFGLDKHPESMELAIDLDITTDQMNPLDVCAGLSLLGLTAPFICVLMLDIIKGQIRRDELQTIFKYALPNFPKLKTLIVVSTPPNSSAYGQLLSFSSLPEIPVPTPNNLGEISETSLAPSSQSPPLPPESDSTRNPPSPVPDALYDGACHIEILQAWHQIQSSLECVVFPVGIYTYADRKCRRYN